MATAGEVGGSESSLSLGSEDFHDLVCQPCQLDGKLQEAVGLCTDCQEYLCQRCFDVHTFPTPTRNHKLLDKKLMVQRQMSLKKEDKCSEKCTVHEDEVIKYYCIDHSQLGCSVCITLEHRSCDNVRYIPHVARDLANNEEYKQAENQLESMMKRSKKVTEEYKQKTKSTEKTCFEAVEMVQEFRKDINKALDKIEADLVNECETLKTEELEKMSQIVEKYKTAQRDLEVLQTMKEKCQNNKQNCNLYIAMMKAKDKLTLAEERFTEVENEQYSINSHIKFVQNKEALNTLKSSELFGKLFKSGGSSVVIPEQTRTPIGQIETTAAVKRNEPLMSVRQTEAPTAVKRNEPIMAVRQTEEPTTVKKSEPIISVRQTEAPTAVKGHEPRMTVRQTEAPTAVKRNEPRTIAEAQEVQGINVKSRNDKIKCNIAGLVILPDNRLLVTDYCTGPYSGGNGNVKLVEQSGWWKKWKVITHLRLSSTPRDVAMITNSQVAVTFPDAKTMAMVNVSATAMNVDRTLNMNGECWGVDYRDGKLAVTFPNADQVQVLTLEGSVLYIITKDKQGKYFFFNFPRYVVFGHDNTSLYVSNQWSNDVVQLKLDGTVVGIYTDSDLESPCGLLTDSSGNVYVCGQNSNNIHQITPDCRKIQVLLTKGDGLDWPSSISYSEAEQKLYVGMWGINVVKEYRVTVSSK